MDCWSWNPVCQHKSRWWRWIPKGLLWQTWAPKLLSEATIASIFKNLTLSWVQRSVDAINGLHRPKRSIVRGQSPCRNYTGEFRSWPPATCRFSTRRYFDHHGKVISNHIIIKKGFKKLKKWNLFVSLIDLIVMKTLLTARLSVTVSSVKTWS